MNAAWCSSEELHHHKYNWRNKYVFFLHEYFKNLNILMDTGEEKMQQV